MADYAPMPATMMHMPMTVQMIMRHGASVFPDSVVADFDGDRVTHTRYGEIARNAVRLANLLRDLGVRLGDRVGTFSWNNREHQEAYLAIPAMGAIMHTINVRLSTEQIAFVINHAEDRVLIVDAQLFEVLAPALPLLDTVQHLLVVGAGAEPVSGAVHSHDYHKAVSQQPDDYPWPTLDENAAAAICYTSGTTGNPKGVVYSHKTTYLHALASRATDTFGICEADRLLLLPPMFHANSWGMPYSGWFSGSDLIMPGPHVQPDKLIRLIGSERPTFSAMVPTVLGDLLRVPEEELDMRCFRLLVSGGSAVPPAMIEAVRERWGVPLLQGWGMTETSPMCVLSHPPRELEGQAESQWRAKSGRPVPGIEVRAIDDSGEPVPCDGETVGELQLRGPWVTGAYHGIDASDSFTADGWLRTGDVGHIDSKYFVQLTDRTKDVIKSGGEWISSVDLENALSAHPDVTEAAVIAVPDERWQERPLAIVVSHRPDLGAEELRSFLRERVARFWIPERWVFVDALEKTSVGKIDKKRLRERRDAGEFEVLRVS
ncbi:long-chain fatty acid--CoA ligase [Pseudohaliea rubra]|uniref:Long-chain-fatty-acid--CoA ligase n=1 Tax=Pseudohaliea rubra DSM 19751 TaxID=1265313 RepID=A0A095VQ17_9GAMM|nr:long-chain fatty acid--CoA ligase [Pseudohaliea rubra]KGE03475.1 Long-chain-fatty-acid--CoA ligase [Pseudohaliea rubra DSM 19751]